MPFHCIGAVNYHHPANILWDAGNDCLSNCSIMRNYRFYPPCSVFCFQNFSYGNLWYSSPFWCLLCFFCVVRRWLLLWRRRRRIVTFIGWCTNNRCSRWIYLRCGWKGARTALLGIKMIISYNIKMLLLLPSPRHHQSCCILRLLAGKLDDGQS
jgi:hypothetical protein